MSNPYNDFTHRATSSGDWNDSSIWESGSLPDDGAQVLIEDGVTVEFSHQEDSWFKSVQVDGTLKFSESTKTHLKVDTFWTSPGSRLEIGTESTPVSSECRVTFVDDGEVSDSERKGRGIVMGGSVEMAGTEKLPWTSLSTSPQKGDEEVDLSESPVGWEVGDRLVFPGLSPSTNQDEERHVESISGSTVTLDSSLDFDHVPPKSSLDSYVLNLSRNIILESENTSEYHRAHGMVMSDDSKFRYVEFREMGRTNKNEPITNPVRNADQVNADDPNPSARYPLHWHRTGSDLETPHTVEGVSIDGSPGWGVVNHHAHVEVTDSITYNVLGAGFVAEGGNERGSFKRNFALRSEGSGETLDSRSAGDHGGDPPIDDFGHAGHGFWLQSPLVEMVDNVAAGHRHHGIVFWLRPLLDKTDVTLAECSEVNDSRVTYCPNVPMEWLDSRQDPLLEAIEAGRFSDKDDLMWDTQKIPSTFAGLRTVSGNEVFASGGGLDFSRHNFKWKHERFSDFNVIDDLTVHSIGTFVDEDGEEHTPDLPKHKASGHQGRGGNVGVSFRYTSNVTLKDSWIIGTDRNDSIGVPFHDYRWTTLVENCTIENWDWGMATGEHRLDWVRNNTFKNNTRDVNWGFDNVGPAVLDGNDLNNVRYEFEFQNQKASEVLEFSQERGVRINGRTAYVDESAPDYVPFPDEESLGGINNIESKIDSVDDETNLVGLTNAEMYDQYGICIGGRPMPSDVVEESYYPGGTLDPKTEKDPSDRVWLDSENASTLGGWEVISEPDSANGECLRCTGSSSPKDNPASLSFDCLSGTYNIYVRARPDAWNGDDIHLRVDGGEWKMAEKLKTPVGFEWHDASPNGGSLHEWNLSEGSHTLDVACGNDGVLVDEVFIVSDETVVGAYGESRRVWEDANEAPVAEDDSASVNKGNTVTVDVLANDSDADGSLDTSSVTVTGGPSNGTATVNSDGTIDYTHDGSSSSSDSFKYTVDDDDGATSNEASVSISVNLPPEAPTNLSAVTPSLNDVVLDWDASNVDEYVVYKDSSEYIRVSTTSAVLSNFEVRGQHEFYVTAVDNEGLESEPSEKITLTGVGFFY